MALAVIILLSSVSLVNGFNFYTSNRRCLLYNKTCVLHCPRMMHAYHTRCEEDTVSQRTCDAPLIYTLGHTCGWSRCDCNNNLVLDEESGTCVAPADCPINVGQRRRKFKLPKADFRLRRKLRLRDYEERIA